MKLRKLEISLKIFLSPENFGAFVLFFPKEKNIRVKGFKNLEYLFCLSNLFITKLTHYENNALWKKYLPVGSSTSYRIHL